MKRSIYSVIIVFLFCMQLFPKFHPRIKWYQIADEKFVVIFPEGYTVEAVDTLEAAADIYRRLADLWDCQVRGKIRILLSDVRDEANGSATFFPFNLIELYLYNPLPHSTIGSYRQWLYQVLSHEMTHIFNLNAGSGLTYLLRRVLGANPFLYPWSYAPVWLVEGMAIYGESSLNEWNRLNTPDFDHMLRHIASAGKARRWPYLFGDSTPWPGPEARYMYGSKFVQFMTQKVGADNIRKWLRESTYYPVPIATAVGGEVGEGKKDENIILLSVRNRFFRSLSLDLHRLWAEFTRSMQVEDLPGFNSPHNRVTFATESGFYKEYPVSGPEGPAYYVNRDYRSFPGIYTLDLHTLKSRRLIKRAGLNGLSYHRETQKLYFSAREWYRNFYRFSDLYEFDLKTNKMKRLTRGARLAQPVRAGRNLYCIKRRRSRSFLAVYDLKTRQERIISGGFRGISNLTVSPDGKHIAVSLKQENRNWRIALFSPAGKLERIYSLHGGKLFAPWWKSTEELFFLAEYEDNYRLALLDIETGRCRVYCDSRTPLLKFFTPLWDQKKILGSFLTFNGYNLGIMNLDALGFREMTLGCEVPEDEEEAYQETVTGHLPRPVTRYRTLADLAPRYVTPMYRYAGNEIQPGIHVVGTDALQKHAFTLAGYYGLLSRTANLDLSYTFDGLVPTFTLRYADLWDRQESVDGSQFLHNSRKFELVALFPVISRSKRQAFWYTDLHFERQRDEFEDSGGSGSVDLNGFTVAFLYGSAQRYYDSFSPADGFNLSLSYAREFGFLGSDYEINTVSLEYKHFISLFRPSVLALRLAAADSWGEARRLFFMGGAESHEGFHTAGSELFDLMRGYPSGYFSGTGGFVLNLEYRISLFKFEKVFLILRSIERFYLSLFADIGNLWGVTDRGKKFDPAFSFGVELNMIAYVGDEKMNLSAGVAAGRRPYHKPVFYVRLGTSF